MKAKLELAATVMERCTNFTPCDVTYHSRTCCLSQGPSGTFHLDTRKTYEENEALARELVRKREVWNIQQEIEAVRAVARRVLE